MSTWKQEASLALLSNEEVLRESRNIDVVEDGTVNFTKGYVMLTSHRLLWRDETSRTIVISLNLSQVSRTEVKTFVKESSRLVLHLNSDDVVELVFNEYGTRDFQRYFDEALVRRKWEAFVPSEKSQKTRIRGVGISQIENKIKHQLRATDSSMQQAFSDVTKLMEMAKDMVNISRSLATKIKDKQGAISDDETVQFKSVLLSMGIQNPVTKETAGDAYHFKLATELAKFLDAPLKKEGVMSLADVYCRVNRARGVELISPDDLLMACKNFDSLKLPIKLRTFSSGVRAVQLRDLDEKSQAESTLAWIKRLQPQNIAYKANLSKLVAGTAAALASDLGISVILAKERLLLAESFSFLCRDETVEGLCFHINLFPKM